MDYWTREKNDAAAAAAAAAATAAAASAAKATAADAAAAKAAAAALKAESGAVHTGMTGIHPEFNAADVKETDWKMSATKISDDTHNGEHWDGPKRGRIIRDYRKTLDGCNISGT